METGILLESGTNELEILEFRVGKNLYGINVAKVREILSYQDPTPVPNADARIEGIFMPRDEIISVIDLAKCLGMVRDEQTTDTDMYIVTNFNKLNAAFHVSAVQGIHRVSWRALQNVDLIRSADIQMREISRLTKETIHLGALDEDSIVYIHKIDSMYNLRMYSRIGRRNPLYSTAIGKVLLAWRDRDEVKQILEGVEYKRSTERTITSTEALLPVLDQVREQGYGEDNEEQEEGLRCIAVPVFDRFGVVIAGLSISFPTLRFSEERLQEYVAMLHTAARKISAQMGYHDYPF